jgi:hypothetical protein
MAPPRHPPASKNSSVNAAPQPDYYEINMTAPSPNLLPINNYHILETRTRKLLKLCMMREKSMAKRSIVH